MRPRRTPSVRIIACALGATMSVIASVATWSGALHGLDQIGFDWHVRRFSSVPADPRILLVDIDDGSLRAMGDWPWPRRRYAQLIDVLHEAGAASVVLDIVLSEPTPPRLDPAGFREPHEAGAAFPPWDGPPPGPLIDDDQELREAIRRAGNVYLATFFESYAPGLNPRAIWDKALDLVGGDRALQPPPDQVLDRLCTLFPALRQPSVAERFGLDTLVNRARLMDRLWSDFDLPVEILIENTSLDRATIEAHLPWAKRAAAARLAETFLTSHPDGTWPSFLVATLADVPEDHLSADRTDLLYAYHVERALRFVMDGGPQVPTSLRERLPCAGEITPPLDLFAQVARGVGFVSFPREETGGVVRDVPLLSDYRGRMLVQLGALAALDALSLDGNDFRWHDGLVGTGADAGSPAFPLSSEGLTPISWHVPRDARDWRNSFQHISAAAVLEVALNREAIAENEKRLRLPAAELVELRHADTPGEYADYIRLIHQRIERRKSGRGSEQASPYVEDQASIELDDAIAQLEQEALVWLTRAYELRHNETPVDAEEKEMHDRVVALYDDLVEGGLVKKFDALNASIRQRNGPLFDKLRSMVRERICLVGFTASGVADVVTAPAYPAVPGVMAHANVMNMLLRNRPAFRAPAAVNTLLTLAAGWIITWWTARRGPLFSAGALLLIVASLLAIGGATFYGRDYHLAMLPVAGTTAAVWACVAVFRQFTEERARREFQRALSQYTSPAVAGRIAERADAADFTPRLASVSCFFSDLYGFTPLSERLGAARTRELLNPYLGEMSRVLIEHGALINKFIGDGIFAFFNAPILPCERHAKAACASALASVDALADLNTSRGAEASHPLLSMRIGLSTGEVFVGDYGSDSKLDYTCIGDTVNVGSRLEAANKALGTTVLVDRNTREAAGAEFAFRYLGRLVLPGKIQPVESYELLGRSADLPAMDADIMGCFERAVRDYQACEWDECVKGFEAYRKRRPDDPAATIYLQLARRRSTPTDPDRIGALVLAGF